MLERSIGGGGAEPDGDVGTPLGVGSDERRMHVRAYNHWVSMLGGRPYPSVADIGDSDKSAFAPHSVLLDFRAGMEDPRVRFIGGSLRTECGVDESIRSVADVPSRSLLSRLTDHYLQIIANRAPVGFEAEFVGVRGTTMMYRGILMPFSSDGDAIDFIYGVINWKELLDEAGTAELRLEMEQALTREAGAAPVWEDGPSHMDEPALTAPDDSPPAADPSDGLADRLAVAREEADRASALTSRGRDALYRAIGRAYDVALAAKTDPEGYAEALADGGLKVQARAPMTPIAKLVFGAAYDKTRLTEIATALTAAMADDVPLGGVTGWLDAAEGGLKGVVARARAARRKPRAAPPLDELREQLRRQQPSKLVSLDGGEEFVLLVARRIDGGHVGLLGPITDARTVDRALATLAA